MSAMGRLRSVRFERQPTFNDCHECCDQDSQHCDPKNEGDDEGYNLPVSVLHAVVDPLETGESNDIEVVHATIVARARMSAMGR
jgi:hypothetical protein